MLPRCTKECGLGDGELEPAFNLENEFGGKDDLLSNGFTGVLVGSSTSFTAASLLLLLPVAGVANVPRRAASNPPALLEVGVDGSGICDGERASPGVGPGLLKMEVTEATVGRVAVEGAGGAEGSGGGGGGEEEEGDVTGLVGEEEMVRLSTSVWRALVVGVLEPDVVESEFWVVR